MRRPGTVNYLTHLVTRVPSWLQEWLGAAALALVTGIGAWMMRLAGRVERHETRLAVVEHQVDQMPTLLESIRDEIKGLREDGRRQQKELYEHIDAFRLEVKDDLKGKADK